MPEWRSAVEFVSFVRVLRSVHTQSPCARVCKVKHFQRRDSMTFVTINVLVLCEALGELPELADVVWACHGVEKWGAFEEAVVSNLLVYLYFHRCVVHRLNVLLR